MFKKLQYRQRLFVYLSSVFLLFTILVLIFQYKREKDFKRDQIEMQLNSIAEWTYNFIDKKKLHGPHALRALDSLEYYAPTENIRITIVDPQGTVLYDSEVADPGKMENHLYRPEIQKALRLGRGANIRESATTGYEYYYYARSFPGIIVRTAAHYDIAVKNFLHVEKVFLFYLITLFLVTWGMLSLITRNLSRTMVKLKEFAIQMSQGEETAEPIDFPEGEFGEISNQIVQIYGKLKTAKGKIEIEKNKLYSHLVALNEGIAFFTPEKKKVLRNKNFIQFLNIISDESNISEEKVFEVGEFKRISEFLETYLQGHKEIDPNDLPHYEEVIYKDKRTFNIHVIVFADKSFEIVIRDITKMEKQKTLKEQITSNLAHELKTPITIILGYLELLENNNLEPDEYKRYIRSAYVQSERLSDLIQDISLLHKMSEARDKFRFEVINLNELIHEVKESFNLALQQKNMRVSIKLAKPILLSANRSLLISVFYNLFDNAIKYGGDNIEIHVNNYLEDANYYYFSFSNTGQGIDEKHFLRIFERFYRVDEHRSRERGGTGLGLSIVKNAIQLHGGEITAGNRKGGGVEFLFTLAKSS